MDKRINKLDWARAFAIIGVILIHLTSSGMFINSPINIELMTLNQWSRFAVPVFIIISGILLSLNNKNENNYLTFIYSRAKKTIPLFLLWSFIYYLIQIYFGKINFNLFSSINNTLSGESARHLYFVPLIFQFYLLFPILKKVKTLPLLIPILILNSILLIIKTHFNVIGPFSLILSHKFFLIWSFYFTFGVYIANKLETIADFFVNRKLLINSILILSLTILPIESYHYISNSMSLDTSTFSTRFTILIFSIICFLSFIINDLPNNKIINYISNASYSIYLSHMLFLFSFYNFANRINLPFNYLYISIGFIFILTGSILTYELSKRFK